MNNPCSRRWPLFKQHAWGRRASVSSLGPTSVVKIEMRLADLSLCGHLHATRGGVFGRKRRSLGHQLPLPGRLLGERPRKQENKIKRKNILNNKSGLFSATSYTATREGSAVAEHSLFRADFANLY
ncbi:hypothetical protein Zmor_006573 [Zophobas morio]|uniref:Uncharacterized protein n=1 Tax=Zophobas morio TaxID=2755281 RepID=A0AA38IXS7_9CUCU|nr:hypothetical protein Zmor_006573 [Zophobas morio]